MQLDVFERTLPVTILIRATYYQAIDYLERHQVPSELFYLLLADWTLCFTSYLGCRFSEPVSDALLAESVLTLAYELWILVHLEAQAAM